MNITLKQLADAVTIDTDVIRVTTFKEDENAYYVLFVVDECCGDFGADLQKVSGDKQKYLDWEVRSIAPERSTKFYGSKLVLEIEIQPGMEG